MVDPVTGWFGMKKYDLKRAIKFTNLAETIYLTRYPYQEEIKYDQGS